MWAFIRTLSLSLEATLNKKIINKNNVSYYLANKFWIGIIPMLIFYFYNRNFIEIEGVIWLSAISLLFATQQFIAFNGLARISATTNIVIKQMRLFFLLIISLIIGTSVSLFGSIGVFLCFIGGILITWSERKQNESKRDSTLGISIALLNALAAITVSFVLGHALDNSLFSSFDYSFFTIVALIILFNALNLRKRKNPTPKFNKKELILLQLTGLLAVTVNLTRALAIDSIGVFYSEIIISLTPIFIYFFAIIDRAERLTLRRTFGVFITVLGVMISFF